MEKEMTSVYLSEITRVPSKDDIIIIRSQEELETHIKSGGNLDFDGCTIIVDCDLLIPMDCTVNCDSLRPEC